MVSMYRPLISRFPKEWQSIFGVLASEDQAINTVEVWHNEMTSTQYGGIGHWASFIIALSEDEPYINPDRSVIHIPRIRKFSIQLQRHILTFVYRHKDELPLNETKILISKLQNQKIHDDIIRMIIVRMKNHFEPESNVENDKNNGNIDIIHLPKHHIFSEENKDYAEKLLNKFRSNQEKNPSIWGVSSQNDSRKQDDMIGMNATNMSDLAPMDINTPITTQIAEDSMETPRKKSRISETEALMSSSETVAQTYNIIHQSSNVTNLSSNITHQPSNITHQSSNITPQSSNIHQPSTITYQSSNIIHQSTNITHQPSTNISSQLSDITHQPSNITYQSSNISHQPSTITHHLMSQPLPISEGLPEYLMGPAARLKEVWTGSFTSNNDVPPEVNIFNQCNNEQVSKLCEYLELRTLSEAAIMTASRHVCDITPEISHNNCVVFLQSSVFPKVIELTQSASRILVDTIAIFVNKYSRALIEGVIVPSITQDQADSFQTELFCKVTKEMLSSSQRQLLLETLICAGSIWTESVILCLQSILDANTELSEVLLNGSLTCMERSAFNMADSKKFGKLTLAIIQKFSHKLTTQHKVSLSRILACHKTFLKKSAEASLKKLN
ncbi:unnamed protein product [Owenia fusiformis]|uniref:Fanconi Anaemia group E protein C-terminal domain-containing protein n=1 Tax=Owenia fusiformis TaxID=6347 RepID=A0A8S4NYW8_OWEFU|nr:unnamed protein product [Owenia fusiformis]